MSNSNAVYWNIEVSQETHQALQSFFEDQGMDATKQSEFVEKAVLMRVFHEAVAEIHAQNRDLDPDQVQTEVDAAVKEVRQERRRELELAKVANPKQ